MKRISYILLFILLFVFEGNANADSSTVKYDTESFIQERAFDAEKLQQAKDNPDYNYIGLGIIFSNCI